MIQITIPNKTGKKYWRSLDQLAGTPAFREWLEREFPAHASEMLQGASRRNMLKLMAASFGLAGLTACRRPVERILPNTRGVEDYIPGKPLFYSTAMTLGGAAAGLLVEVNDGRPTKVEGNPEHPFSLGAANSFQQASVLGLYDPDRARRPRTDGRYASWEELTVYLRQEFDPAKLGQGAGLRFLSERVTSPSLAAVRAHALSKFPAARWVEYDAIDNTSAATGARLAFGRQVVPRYSFDKADVVLSLDCDFLGLDSPTVLPVKEFARRRRVSSEKDGMNRLYVVESQYSVTGGAADHRLRMRSSDVQAFAENLAAHLTNSAGSTDQHSAHLAAIAKDLNAHRSRSLVVAGPRQPAAVHALAHLMNEALGNAGSTVTYLEPRLEAFQSEPQVQALRELAGEMSRGEVKHLLILGGNPVYTAPADLEFEANLKKVSSSVYLGLELDETAAVAKWTVPEAHYLESWGDVAAPDGTVTIQQPMIQPLHGGKTAAEVVALISGYKDQRPYDIVRNHWLSRLPGVENDKSWRKALHDGVVPNTAYPAAQVSVNRQRISEAIRASRQPGEKYELVFVPSAATYDGRFANNGWMQEAADPMTKLTWDNAALISTATARDLGLEQGDMVFLERAGRKIEAPVLVQPGQADGSISIALGYGRQECGRVGKGVGANAYKLRTSDALAFAQDLTIRKAGRKYPLSQTQDHHTMVEPITGLKRPIVREATLEEWRKEPDFAKEAVEHPPLISLYGDHKYDRGYQWGMAIDLNSCIGCTACMVACQAENNIPIVGKEEVANGREMHWIRMDRYYTGNVEDPQVVNQPVPCMQCENAPCENVCPVAATVHSPEGLNDMAYNRCVGTRYCSNNCPYKVRRFNFFNFHYGTPELQHMVHNPDVTVRMRGVMEKCTDCVQRIQEKKIQAKSEGRRELKD
ncbi:MAG: TAT-variant-translocated molybdopterin oxidoreductase, partial [Bryobacteraceae bacterium]